MKLRRERPPGPKPGKKKRNRYA
jgi:hypothetical protein